MGDSYVVSQLEERTIAASRWWRASWVVLVGAVAVAVANSPGTSRAAEPQFERDILPILQAKCLKCHDGKQLKGELDLRSLGSILKGGESGPAVVTVKPDESLLLERVVSGDMPPGTAEKLTPAEIELIRAWIASGLMATESPDATVSSVTAEDRAFWSFRSLSRPAVPEVRGQPRTLIDSFIFAKLEGQNLSLASESDPRRLVRRLYFDLLGLPPSPQELEAFLADTASDAYDRLVDRLLASIHFGERWARHWLDTVGYTDTVSYDGDTNFVPGFIKGRWRYRDYVVDSLNADKPYDQFLTEQIAGDELVSWRDDAPFDDEVVSMLAATGFWRNSEDRSDSAKEVVYKWSILHETMQTFGTSVLGLTLRCARCHSHKHEPIPQEDYYRLLSLITPAFNIEKWKAPKERALPALSAADKAKIDARNAAIEKENEELTKQAKAVRDARLKIMRDAKIATVPEADRQALRIALDAKVQERTPKQATLVQHYAEQIDVTKEELEKGLSDTERANVQGLEAKVAEGKKRLQDHGWIQAVYDVGSPPATHLLKRGDFTRLGREVEPGFLTVLEETVVKPKIVPLPASSGRRTALAKWLTKPETPAAALVARVIVNRVWQHLMGVGIVASSENLGVSGSRPTHPELLEWLASEFVEGGWRIKPLVRQIVTSAVYRQTSRRDLDSRADDEADPLQVDPGNQLLWQARLRRLESEAIRDSMLVTAGVFDSKMGGPPVPIFYKKDGLASYDMDKMRTPTAKWRRTLYLFQRRVYHMTLMGVFDQPSVAGSTCRRASSAVALQSLTLLNDDVAMELAEEFGKRVYASAGSSVEEQIETAFACALGRSPDDAEREWSADLLRQQTQVYREAVEDVAAASNTGGALGESGESKNDRQPEGSQGPAEKALMHLCRVLFNSSEFLYIE